ncbi:tRNA1(Val) (adenine(37)-N6)-methyltransferase [Paracoccus sp. JM45]|uniref:tRNA1(Val) (adenine(37)-N6)-methyltransferase n=1 Tax=Paracoccus sp. JM45 TaxID=2283626 RepID=UPI000E6B8D96|nr:methyltransferase [Paracoccus sp. JM45]RJE80454.1 methyltransferase domain-containing protein [Paracoccus sp. JM45]
MTDHRIDDFLGGRLRIAQPVRGYRAGADAVMLAAACPAQAGKTVLELGCGAGVASLCLGWRVQDLAITGLERHECYARLARENATFNRIAMQVVTGDLASLPAPLRGASFDHVIMNPPYFLAGKLAPDAGRADARTEATPLDLWIDTGLRRLKTGGWLTIIQRADRLDNVMGALAGRAGGITVLPIAARHGREAGRVILSARKGARAPFRLLAPFILHDAMHHQSNAQDMTLRARGVLRDGLPIHDRIAKVS